MEALHTQVAQVAVAQPVGKGQLVSIWQCHLEFVSLKGHGELDLCPLAEAHVIVSLLPSPVAAVPRVADNGGFVEARVKVQGQFICPLAQVNSKAAKSR